METETKLSRTTESQRLPDEIILDIVSRLPVLYLLQYRCVCKSWHAMISHPQFLKTHLRQSTQSSQSLMITHPWTYYFISLDCESFHESKILDLPWKNWFSDAEVLCSFDGLVLLCFRSFSSPNRNSSKTFILWNPSIRKYLMFSRPCDSNNSGIYKEFYGLCFDSSTNGYKVIILSQNLGIIIWIFDLKTLSWKETRDSSFSISSRQNGVTVNGVSHWIMTSNQCHSPVIVYFDVVEEKFKEVPKPDYGNENHEFGLTGLRGWLCVYQWMDQVELEVWAMKEYGKKESWTKLISIPNIIGSNFLNFCKPLCLTKNGEVLVEINDRELAVFDPEECTLSTPLCLNVVRSFMAARYVESLVLLNDGNDTTKVQPRKVNPNRVYRNTNRLWR